MAVDAEASWLLLMFSLALIAAVYGGAMLGILRGLTWLFNDVI